MHCSHCKSLMAETEKTSEGASEQLRFECPVCGGVALSARPLPAAPGPRQPLRSGVAEPTSLLAPTHRYPRFQG